MPQDTSEQISLETFTESSSHEEALHASRVRHRNLFDSISSGCAYCKMIFEENRPVDFIHEVVNLNFEHMIGIKELEGLKISDVLAGFNTSNPEFFERLERVTQSGVAERFKYYINVLSKWFDISIYSQSKEYFVLILSPIHTVNPGIWEWNLDNGKMVWSDELRMLFGLDQLSSEPFYDVWRKSILPSDLMHSEQAIQTAIAKGIKFSVVCRVLCRDGMIRRLMHQGIPVKGSGGIENRYIISCIDITEYKHEDITCPINKINLDTLLNSSLDPCCFLALDGTIHHTNKYFNDIYAKEGEILTGQNFHKRFPCNLPEERKARFDRVFYTGESIYYKDKCLGLNNMKLGRLLLLLQMQMN
jgi:PAS domain-containing protein